MKSEMTRNEKNPGLDMTYCCQFSCATMAVSKASD